MPTVKIAGYDVTGYNRQGERITRSFSACAIGEYQAWRLFQRRIVTGSLWRVLRLIESPGVERQHRTLLDRIH